MLLHRISEGGEPLPKRLRTYVLLAILAIFLSSCGELTQVGSPVEVTNRTLSETIAERAELAALQPVVEEPEEELDLDNMAPEALAFAEALESGEIIEMNIIAGVSGAGLFNGPSDVYEQLEILPSGRDVEATGEVSGEWAVIVHDGIEGWVEARRLTLHDLPERDLVLPEPDPSIDGTGASGVYVVGSVGVNIRTQPNADGRLLTSASSGDRLQATGNTSRHWVEVSYNGITGWASGNYVSPA